MWHWFGFGWIRRHPWNCGGTLANRLDGEGRARQGVGRIGLHDALEFVYAMGSICVFESFDGLGALCKGGHDSVVWRDDWVCDVFVLELDCVADTTAVRCFDVALMCLVMFIRSG